MDEKNNKNADQNSGLLSRFVDNQGKELLLRTKEDVKFKMRFT